MSTSALISVTNTPMFDLSHVVSIKPVIVFFNFGSKKKNKKLGRSLIVVKAQSSASVAGFEPSFDEYLKAMESVKTVRDKRSKARTIGVENGESGGGFVCNRVDDEVEEVNDAGYRKNERWERGKGSNDIDHPIRDEPVTVNEVGYVKNGRWERDKADNVHGSIRDESVKGNIGKAQSSSSSSVVGFESSFDEYLKAMENVKTVREKRSKAKIGAEIGNSEEPNEGGSRGFVRSPVEDNVVKANEIRYRKNGRWERENDDNGRFVHDSIRDEHIEVNEIGYGKIGSLDKDKGNNRGLVRSLVQDKPIKGNERKIGYGENGKWEKDKGSNRGYITNAIQDEPAKRKQGNIGYGGYERWEKDKGKDRAYVSNRNGDEYINVNERNNGYRKDVRWEKQKIYMERDDNDNGWSYSNSIQDKSMFSESKYGVEATRRSDMNSRNGRWEGNRNNSSFVKDKDYSFKIDEYRTRDTRIVVNGSKRFDRHDENVRWERDQGRRDSLKERDYNFRGDRDRFGGSKMAFRNEKVSVNNVMVRRRNGNLSEESDEDEEFQFERAAFKPVNGFDDIVDKPRITRNEMEERIQKLARCLNGADVNMPEWMFSKMMRSARVRYSDHSILRIIQFLGKLGNWKRVLQLIDWLQSHERFKSHKLRHIYTTALGVLGKARRPVEALNLFQIMQQNLSTYPDLVAYHSIAVTLGQAGHMRELFEVIDVMKSPPKKKFKTGNLDKWDPRLEPDIVVYNAVLNACVKRKQWEGAFWVLQQLKEKGQPPSATTYGLVMEVMLACEKYNLVHDFYRKMLKSSLPNALTYKVLVNTLWREGKIDEAILAVEDMERRGVVGSAALYYDLARCLCSAGRCQEALVQVDKIVKVANKPLVITYTGLMQACLDAGNIKDGSYIFDHMHKFCSPNLVTCNIILKAYIDHAKFKEAKNLFHKLLKGGNGISSKGDYKDRVIPDKYSFSTMLDACGKEQDWDEFEVVYKGMLDYGYPFNAKRHLGMIIDAGRAGKGELLKTTWNRLIQYGPNPPPHQLVKEMFHIKLKQGDYSTALSYLSTHSSSNLQAFSCNAWLKFFDENAHRLQKENLVRLLNEVNFLISESEDQPLVLHNLVLACKEYLNTRMNVSQRDDVETQTVLC